MHAILFSEDDAEIGRSEESLGRPPFPMPGRNVKCWSRVDVTIQISILPMFSPKQVRGPALKTGKECRKSAFSG